MTLETLTAIFGWITLLNFAVLLFAGLAIFLLEDWMSGIHSRLLRISPAEARTAYFSWLANYKLLTLVFCLVPYLAMRLVA